MESPEEGHITVCMAKTSDSATLESTHNFESLPPELILSIIEYVPEAICELRLASQALKALVDEFVSQCPTIPPVHKLSFIGYYQWQYDDVEEILKENDRLMIQVWLTVPVRMAQLFELRVKWCGIDRTKMGRHENEDWEQIGYVNRHCFGCDISDSNDPNTIVWNRMREVIGSNIDHVDVKINEKTELSQMCSLFDQFHIKKLKIDIERFSGTEIDVLLETVKHHKLEWLSLRISASTTTSLAAEFLLELSTNLQTLHIHGDIAINNAQKVPLIIEMLSRKLDKLEMKHWRGEFLTREDADRLIMHLPFIGKKLWFKVGFALNTVGRSNKLNGHIIHETCPIPRPNKPRKDRALTIIHKSRLNEVSYNGYYMAKTSDPAILESMPNFETLPPEVVLNIIEYVPEDICELRLTSQALKALADEFVRQRPTISLVHMASFNDYYCRYGEVEKRLKENDPGTMSVGVGRYRVVVPARAVPLFELRVKWFGVNRTGMLRHENEDRGPLGYMNSYSFNCGIPAPNDLNASDWARLAESMGMKIKHVYVAIRENTELAQMCSLLEKFHIEKLEVSIERFTDSETSVLLKTVERHKIEWLSLRILTSITPTLAEFLLELSMHLRTLHIGGNYAVDNMWVPAIVEMFSNKLDTLVIDHWPGEILSREDADRLILHLPFIGKKLWFKAGFALNTVGRSNKINGHIIHETCPKRYTNKPPKERALTIIHKSRLTEVQSRAY